MPPANQASVAVSFFLGELSAAHDDIDLATNGDYMVTDIEVSFAGGATAESLVLSETGGSNPFFSLIANSASAWPQNRAEWHGEMLVPSGGFRVAISTNPALIAITGYKLIPSADFA
jgi:hypothetical protein